MPVKIRPEKNTDREDISHLHYLAFKGHPQHSPGSEPTEHKIVAALRHENALSLSLVAELEETIAGHIAFSPVTINGKERNWYGLGPVGVLPELQGKGIGSALIYKGIELIGDLGAGGIVLVGEPKYYNRFGFVREPRLILSDVPEEFFLTLSFTMDAPHGEVEFHPAFFTT